MLPNLYGHMLNAFLLAVVLIMVVRQQAYQLKLVDIPDARKRHDGIVPLCGGVAIFTAFTVSCVPFDNGFPFRWNWEIGLGMLVLLGVADDRWRLSAGPKLGVQLLAAIVLLGMLLQTPLNLGELPTGPAWQLPMAAGMALTVVFLVGTINAINMIDGVDGLAGTSVAAALLWLALLGVHSGNPQLALQACVLMAAVAGFLVFNLRHPWQERASVFLGDGGSLMLGAALAYFIVVLAAGENGLAFPILLWIVIVPVADTLSLIARRLSANRNPLSADRWHLHHLLIDSGWSPAMTTALISGASALCGAIGYVGIVAKIPSGLMLVGLTIPLLLHSLIVWTLSRRADPREDQVPSAAIVPLAAVSGLQPGDEQLPLRPGNVFNQSK